MSYNYNDFNLPYHLDNIWPYHLNKSLWHALNEEIEKIRIFKLYDKALDMIFSIPIFELTINAYKYGKRMARYDSKREIWICRCFSGKTVIAEFKNK